MSTTKDLQSFGSSITTVPIGTAETGAEAWAGGGGAGWNGGGWVAAAAEDVAAAVVVAAPVATTLLRVVRRATPAQLNGLRGLPIIASAFLTEKGFIEELFDISVEHENIKKAEGRATLSN